MYWTNQTNVRSHLYLLWGAWCHSLLCNAYMLDVCTSFQWISLFSQLCRDGWFPEQQMPWSHHWESCDWEVVRSVIGFSPFVPTTTKQSNTWYISFAHSGLLTLINFLSNNIKWRNYCWKKKCNSLITACCSDHKVFTDEESSTYMFSVLPHRGHIRHRVLWDIVPIYDFTPKY